MDRGFQTVLVKIEPVKNKDAGTLLKTTGMALVGSVGGAGGPLYGTFFLRAGAALDGKSDVSREDLVSALEAGLKGVVERGKANLKDKTMVDALTPAIVLSFRFALPRSTTPFSPASRSEEHTAELQSHSHAVSPLLLENI